MALLRMFFRTFVALFEANLFGCHVVDGNWLINKR